MTTLNLADGYYDLPPGKLVSVVTLLAMHRPPQRSLFALRRPWHLEPLTGASTLEIYRSLYRDIGEEWLWFSRRVMSDDSLIGLLEHPGIACFALTDGTTRAGLLELDFRDGTSCELAFFGVLGEFQGGGLGRAMLDKGIKLAFQRPIERFWLHTCTHDSPKALPFYLRSGFLAYGRQIEVHEDYRLSGLLPRSAAPHIPLLES